MAAASLPRIACFHGGGSTAAIFKVQCTALQHSLSDIVELVFFDAPFERDAGPGVLPYFDLERFGPYRTWFSKEPNGVERPDGRGVMGTGEGGLDRVVRLLLDEGEGGQWIGCMGFSQGTRVVGGLLLEQMRLRDLGAPGLAGGAIEFKFGVLCMGGAAPMLAELSYPSNLDVIDIPTLHLHGLADVNLENGRKQLANYYNHRTTTLIEINYHHAMPWNKQDFLTFSTAVRKMYITTQHL